MNRYIKYALISTLSMWLANKIGNKVDEHISNKKH